MLPACGLLMRERSTIPAKPLVTHLTLAAGCKLAETRNSLWWLESFNPMPTSTSGSYDPLTGGMLSSSDDNHIFLMYIISSFLDSMAKEKLA